MNWKKWFLWVAILCSGCNAFPIFATPPVKPSPSAAATQVTVGATAPPSPAVTPLAQGTGAVRSTPQIGVRSATPNPLPSATLTYNPDMPTAAASATPPRDTAGTLLYKDPVGQFSLRLPGDWAEDPQTGYFTGKDGFYRQVYLPEMAFMDRAYRVCERLAYLSAWDWKTAPLTNINGVDGCTLDRNPPANLDTARVVIKNPKAAPQQRYFMIEADRGHIDWILSWLAFKQPFTADEAYYLNPAGAMRPADKAFWGALGPLPGGMAVISKPLIKAGAGNPGITLLQGLRQVAATPVETSQWRIETPAGRDVLANLILERFGYQFKVKARDMEGKTTFTLLKGSEPVLDGINYIGLVTTSVSGKDFALVVNQTVDGRRWLVRSDSLTEWNSLADTLCRGADLRDPIFFGEDLLCPTWNSELGQVQIIQKGQSIFSFTTWFGAEIPVNLFTQWAGRWLLEINDFLIQDGVIQNEVLGFEEIFGWRLLDGKPFFFFRKGPRVGISYNDNILPLSFDAVFHGGCCEYASLNPAGTQYMLHFYALQAGMWQDVTLGFKP